MHGRRSSLKHLSDNKELSKYLPIKLGIKRNTFSFIFPKQIYPQITEIKPVHLKIHLTPLTGIVGFLSIRGRVGVGWGLAHWVHQVPRFRPFQNYSSCRLGFQLLCHLTGKKDPFYTICFLGSGDLPFTNENRGKRSNELGEGMD